MRFSPDILESIRQRTDIVRLVGQGVELKRAGAAFKGLSPFANEKTPSFTVNPTRQRYHCFSSGKDGDVFTWMMEFHNMSYVDAVKELAKEAGVALPEQNKPQSNPFTPQQMACLDVLEKTCDLWKSYIRDNEEVLNYLKNERKITGEAARAFRIGFAPNSFVNTLVSLSNTPKEVTALVDSGVLSRHPNSGALTDRFRYRVVMPVLDTEGRVRGFTGRYIGPPPKNSDFTPPKYLNSPESPVFNKGKLLFGLYQALKANPRPESLVFVEGAFDVVMPHVHNVCNVVAPMGTALTPDQIQLALRYTKHIVFCLDSDKAGRDAALRGAALMAPFIDEKVSASFVTLAEAKDPDEYIKLKGAEAFAAELKSGVPFSTFVSQMHAEKFSLLSAEGRAAYAAEMSKLIATMRPSMVREALAGEVAALAHVNPAALTGGDVSSTQTVSARHPASTLAYYVLKDPQKSAYIPRVVSSEISDTDFLLLSKLCVTQRKTGLTTGEELVAALGNDKLIEASMDLLRRPPPGIEVDPVGPFWLALKDACKKVADRKLDFLVDQISEMAVNGDASSVVEPLDRALQCMGSDSLLSM